MKRLVLMMFASLLVGCTTGPVFDGVCLFRQVSDPAEQRFTAMRIQCEPVEKQSR